MKAIILFFLLTMVSFGQIHVVGDTTDLKTYRGSGIVLLEQYGGGSELLLMRALNLGRYIHILG